MSIFECFDVRTSQTYNKFKELGAVFLPLPLLIITWKKCITCKIF